MPDGVFPIDGLPRVEGSSIRVSSAGDEVDRWSGGFSFAIWDREQRALRAYRDHYGARPLYYAARRGRVYLSGDIPSLLGPLTDARLDEIAIAEYLATGAPTENRTFHDGIARVPAASLLCVDRNGIRTRRYWNPWDGRWAGRDRPADVDKEFRRLFRRAVLSCFDGHSFVGFLLSGGPDSSSVLGMAASLCQEGILDPGSLKTALTLSFEENADCDEGSLARETAERWGVRWKAVPIEDISPLYTMDRFLEAHGEPPCTANLAIEMRLFEAARTEGVRVVLDGHDADVLFSPSGSYLSELARGLRWVRLAREVVALRRHHQFTPSRLLRETLAPLARRHQRASRVPDWIRPDLARKTNLRDRMEDASRIGGSFEEREAMRVLTPSVGLSLEATRSMERLCGIEGRHPYFDPALIRFLVSVPLRHRFQEGATKILIRRALADLLTPDVRSRIRKTNYRPYFDWSLRRHLGRYLESLRDDRGAYIYSILDHSRVSSMISLLLRGESPNSLALWRALALDRWVRFRQGQQPEDTDEIVHAS